MNSIKVAPDYYAQATVWIKDDYGTDVNGATVYGEWTGLVNETENAITEADGIANFESSKIKSSGTFNFCVTDVVASGYTYDDTMNVETCDSITAP